MGGSDKASAPVGALAFLGWAVIGWLSKAAGFFTGKFVLAGTIWNALFGLYCLKEAVLD